MSTQNAINQGDSTRIFSGIEAWGGSGAYYDDTTLGSFTLLRGGVGYIKGRPVTWAGSQTVTGLTAGNLYWIYIDITGTLQKTSTFASTTFTDNIPLFECLRDSTTPTNNQYTVREDHPYYVEGNTSIYLHNVIGPVIRNTNNGANITLNGTQKIQINGEDYLEDHGLVTTIPDSGGVAVTFRKVFTDAAGKWCTYSNTDTFTGHYNNAGTVTALTAGYFAVYTLYVSKDTITSSTPTYYAVLNTAQFNTIGAAQSAISAGTTARATNELYNLELAQLGYIIFRQSTNAIAQVTVSKSTLKQTLSTSGSNIASLISTVTTNFDAILSAADTNVQAALETIDEWGKAPSTVGTFTTTAGNLSLPTTSSTAGQIKVNSALFGHSKGTRNTFWGEDAGNTSITTSNHVGIGFNALKALAYGDSNTAVGAYSLDACGATAATGANSAFGYGSGTALTTGSYNIFFGKDSGYQLTTGEGNTLIGTLKGSPYGAGSAYTGAESFNICINNAGVNGESHKIRIGTYGSGDNQQDAAYIAGVVHASNGFIADTGNISIPTTTSTVGQYQINSSPVFHTYGTDNLFLGGAGNFTLSGSDSNIGIGTLSLVALNNGDRNIAIGKNNMNKITDGNYNCSIGVSSLYTATTSKHNMAFGYSSLFSATTGNGNNVAIGTIAGWLLTTGANNVMIGGTNNDPTITTGTGSSYTSSESNNILIHNTGVVGESNVIRIGTTGSGVCQQNKIFLAGAYGVTVGATNAYAVIDNAGQLGTTATIPGTVVWAANSGTSITAASGSGYILTSSSTVTVTLPSSPTVGDQVGIVKLQAGVLNIYANTSQVIYIQSIPSTAGPSHGVSSATSTAFRKMQLLYYDTNKWVAIDMAGSWTLV